MNRIKELEDVNLEKIRLQKFLAEAGICSRRKAEELMTQGKIKVNGKVIKELGIKVDPENDAVEYNGGIVKREENKVYILLNKPIGYVTTVKEQFDRDKVTDLIKGVKERLVPVGRLDMYTSGALILSNDGEFINKVTHPKNEIEKTYNVTLLGKITKDEVKKLQDGVEINLSNDILNDKFLANHAEVENKRYLTKPAKVKILKIDEEKNLSRLQITIHEGKNREIRKMCEAIDKKVLALHRAKIGNIDVKDLKLGKWRYLTEDEIRKLLK